MKYAKERYPKISVITVVFNCASMVERAIQSLLAQGYPNLEYLVLDGGSKDGTVEVLERYREHMDYFRSHADEGPSHAINEGVAHATGDLVLWLNADDYYMDGILMQVGEAFIENPDTEMVNFLGRVVTRQPDGQEQEIERITPERMDIRDGMARTLYPNCRAVRRDCYQKFGGALIETIAGRRAIYTDYEFVKRLAIHGVRNTTIPVLGYTYVAHANSLSFSGKQATNLKMHDERALFIEKLFKDLSERMTNPVRKQLRTDWKKSLASRVVKQWVAKDMRGACHTVAQGVRLFGIGFMNRVVRTFLAYYRS